jgi:hypothetical protein
MIITGAGLYIIAGMFTSAAFKGHMNQHYFPLENMRKSVAKLKASSNIYLPALEYGQYQPILAPLDGWPKGSGSQWMKEMGMTRLDLTAQPNCEPLSNDEPDNIPLTRCALLDAAVRKCFNSDPPIPMLVDVAQKAQDESGSDVHSIKINWEYGNGNDKTPTILNLMIICPYRPATARRAAPAEKAMVAAE